jgi:hypothetical protein
MGDAGFSWVVEIQLKQVSVELGFVSIGGRGCFGNI